MSKPENFYIMVFLAVLALAACFVPERALNGPGMMMLQGLFYAGIALISPSGSMLPGRNQAVLEKNGAKPETRKPE